MKKDLIEMVFILDRSGSMGNVVNQTIEGFNELILKQKALPGEAIISTVLFDHEFHVLHNRVPLETVKRLTKEDYYVRGTTALLDAMGRSIMKIRRYHHDLTPDQRPEKTVFVITTDGLENASRSFDYQDVKTLIESQKAEYGWEFMFLGANIDSVRVASRVGIHKDRATNFHSDAQGTALNYRVLNETVSDIRKHKRVSSQWKDKIDADYKNRK